MCGTNDIDVYTFLYFSEKALHKTNYKGAQVAMDWYVVIIYNTMTFIQILIR